MSLIEMNKSRARLAKDLIRTTILATISLIVASCSTYPSKFKCGDARGLGCTMVRDIDKQINSGKIEEAYNKECRGNRCSSASGLVLNNKERARLYRMQIDKEEQSDHPDNDNLYF